MKSGISSKSGLKECCQVTGEHPRRSLILKRLLGVHLQFCCMFSDCNFSGTIFFEGGDCFQICKLNTNQQSYKLTLRWATHQQLKQLGKDSNTWNLWSPVHTISLNHLVIASYSVSCTANISKTRFLLKKQFLSLTDRVNSGERLHSC